MLENYWVQPSKLENNKFQHWNFEVIHPPKENNAPINCQAESLLLGNPKQMHEESIKVETFQEEATPHTPPTKLERR